MPLDRRRFLTAATAVSLSGVAVPRALAAAAVPAGRPDWGWVRDQFRLNYDIVHMETFLLSSHPAPVRRAIREFSEKLDADCHWAADVVFDATPAEDPVGDTKRALARYLSAAPEELALVPNTTTGLALVYNGLTIRPDQEILLTTHDHYSHVESARRAGEKKGVPVRFVTLHDDAVTARPEQLVSRLRAEIGPRTRAVGITWVHSSSGLRMPIAEVADMIATINEGRSAADRCLLIVDGVHGFGALDLDFARSGVDFLATGAHKWLHGPRGTGVVYGRADAWPHVQQTVPTFEVEDGLLQISFKHQPLPPTKAHFVSLGGFVAYDHLFALPAAVEFHERIGKAAIEARVLELNGVFQRELPKIKGVIPRSPRLTSLQSGIVSFDLEGKTADETVARLLAEGIRASTSPYEVPFARVSAGIMNTPRELDRTLTAIRKVAAS
ncbi:aminotransferase class V-fold PLP-dependent enzyme [Actinokineospora enzanensis]|uniref:aminotransferase class V-fold PLP-dependent enzyme n=1 Tax=Actinokineospora enzanensis TaxID=155975 RepID=UPI00037AB715|nr:aminotransferase class V-fold PLP-dependent enzyme [Actinokineospora enzanensis]